MKLQILNQSQEPVGGYQTLIVDRNQIDLSQITNNECEFILAADVFDSFTAVAIDELVDGLLSKLRLNGELVVGGTDVRLFARAVSNGLISPDDASDLVTSVHSMTSGQRVREVLEKSGLQIMSFHMDGLHYEVKAKRTK